MKRIILVLVLAGLAFTASSQKVYFLYLQAEPVQPFFVKMNGKIHSSSASGYLILAKLYDSTYSFTIGFNQSKSPEQAFIVKMGQKDHGYLLKNFGDKGWGLFDLQNLGIQYSATAVAVEQKMAEPKKEVSPFTDLLSKATGDPSLRDKPPAPKAEVKPDIKAEAVVVEQPKPAETKTVPVEESKAIVNVPPAVTEKALVEKKEEAAPVNKETTAVKTEPVAVIKEEKKEEQKTVVKEPEPKQTEPVVISESKTVIPEVSKVSEPDIKKEEPKAVIEEQTPVKTEPVPEKITEYQRSVVTKRSESSTTEGFGLVFMDRWEGGRIDTIRLLIPNPKQVVALVKEEPKQEKKFLEIQATAVNTEEKVPVVEDKPKPAEPLMPIVKPKTAEKEQVVEEKPKQTEPVTPNVQPKTEDKPVQAEKPLEKPALPAPCAEVAVEADFFALRKSMAASEGDDDMISQAKKYFRQKCFTPAQLKNLSALFLNDEAKYNFFDAAYKYTTDKTAFAALETELKDTYYINRFRAMIR